MYGHMDYRKFFFYQITVKMISNLQLDSKFVLMNVFAADEESLKFRGRSRPSMLAAWCLTVLGGGSRDSSGN
jgi:hypothetical protein